MMRRLNLLLLGALQLCDARSRSFNIHEDLLAFPQYEVIFSETFISEKDASALLESNAQGSTYSADFSQPTVGEAPERDANDRGDGPGGESKVDRFYEVMNMAPHRYLCSIPLMQPSPPENQTETELAKAEEAQELSRAVVNGWELLAKLEDTCLYFMSGWWSYSFCQNREIVQFHAVTSVSNGQPPRPDPNSVVYVLGKEPAIPGGGHSNRNDGDYDDEPLPAEIQVKGDQRFLVQRLVGGTVCDLTNRERTIEVQYHCAPNLKSDRIGWIKEVTICAYLMVVNTPRLCNDVAFLPPEEKKANPISCSLIADGEEKTPPLIDQNELVKGVTTSQAQRGQSLTGHQGLTVGGVVVGARHILSHADEAGKPPVKLTNPRAAQAGQRKSDQDKMMEALAQVLQQGGGETIEIASAEDLENLELGEDVIEELKKAFAERGGEDGWRLELVEFNGDKDNKKESKDEGKEDDEKKGNEGKTEGGETQGGEGSEEVFKDEL